METRTIKLYKFSDLPLFVQCVLLDKRFQDTKRSLSQDCYKKEHLSKYLIEAGFDCHNYGGSYSISIQSAKNRSEKIRNIAENTLKSGDAILIRYDVNLNQCTMQSSIDPDNFKSDRHTRVKKFWKNIEEIEFELFRILREALDAADRVPHYPSREQIHQQMLKENILYFQDGEQFDLKRARQLGINL